LCPPTKTKELKNVTGSRMQAADKLSATSQCIIGAS
jgi:hypothetical protein